MPTSAAEHQPATMDVQMIGLKSHGSILVKTRFENVILKMNNGPPLMKTNQIKTTERGKTQESYVC